MPPAPSPYRFHVRHRKMVFETLIRGGLQRDIRNVLYAVQANPPTGLIKIGRSNKFFQRWTGILSSWPELLEVKCLVQLTGAEDLEGDVHWCLSNSREHGEWFRPTPEVLKFCESAQTLESLTEYLSSFSST